MFPFIGWRSTFESSLKASARNCARSSPPPNKPRTAESGDCQCVVARGCQTRWRVHEGCMKHKPAHATLPARYSSRPGKRRRESPTDRPHFESFLLDHSAIGTALVSPQGNWLKVNAAL